VAIVVPCPHCGTRVNLPADLNGKQTQCPNLGCRKTFVVKGLKEKAPPEPDLFELPAEPTPEPPPPPPKPKAPAPKPAAQKPAQPKPPKPKPAPLPPPPSPVEDEVIAAEVVSGPEVKEVVWSEGTDVPPPPPVETKKKKPAPKPAVEGDDDDLPVRRNKKKGNRRPLILAGMAIVAVGLVIFAVLYGLGMSAKKEEQLAAKAKEHYERGEYPEATKGFEQLVKEYPEGKKVDEYKFFAALAQMQSAVRSVTNREDYEPGVKKLNEFVAAHKDEPLAKPGTGFGRDVLEAGKKLGEDVASNAADRVKAYQGDRAGKAGELARAEKAIAAGRALLPVLDPFRGPDDGPLAKVIELLDDAEKGVKREKDRSAALARATAQLANPTDAVIQSVVAELEQAGFLEDGEAQALIAAAKGRLRGIRHAGARDESGAPLSIRGRAPKGLFADAGFRRGLALLGARGLTFDTWIYHHQLPDYAALARAVPGTAMILDHFGTPLGVGPYAGRRNEIFAKWKDDIAEVAACPNVYAKLGGMAMPDNGYGWNEAAKPPGSDEFAEVQAPWYHHAIKLFGPERCMFESNFPVDRLSIGYRTLWNGLKKIAGDYPESAKEALFSRTARKVYKL